MQKNRGRRWRRTQAVFSIRAFTMNRRTIHLHRSKHVWRRRVSVVENHRRRGTSSERTRRRAAIRQGGRKREISWSSRVSLEDRSRWTFTRVEKKRRASKASRCWYERVSIRSWVDILRAWSSWKCITGHRRLLEKLETLRNGTIAWVEFRSPSISVDSIGRLVVAALIQRPQIKPNLRNVRIDANGA